MDARQKAKDLLNLAVDSSTSQQERDAAARQCKALVDKYNLLDGKPVNVATDALKELFRLALSGELVDTIVGQAEKYASGIERVMAAGKRITDARGPAASKRRKRTYR
jgi:hypothetical protein